MSPQTTQQARQAGLLGPNGQWIAYTDNSGIFGIYVEPFPPSGAKYQITGDGEAWPVWSADGKRLVFRRRLDIQSETQLMAVDVAADGTLSWSELRELPVRGAAMVPLYRDYDLMPDGEGILVIYPAEEDESRVPGRPRFQIVLNWFEELKARVSVP